MFVTYTSMPYSLSMVATWAVGGLAYVLLAAFVLDKMKA
jgi:hypothetical protein